MTQPKTASKFTPGPAETDWRPKQMHGLPRNNGRPACGCYVHYGMNFSEWIFCPLHAKAPEMYELLRKLLTLATEPEKAGDCEWPSHLGNIIEHARRIKAAIDGEG